jgi:cytochrome P450/pimeloyl-ACP methyl ester carboxylesterase
MEERELELGSGRTHVRIEGSGRALVWAHGFTSSIAMEEVTATSALWRGIPDLSVVRYDARGHGRSAPGRDEAAQRWDALGTDLLELVTRLGLERPLAGGASMGAATALHAAVTRPGAFGGLVLLVPPTAWETRKAQADLYNGGAALVEARGVEAYAAIVRETLHSMPGLGEELAERMVADLRARSAPDLVRGLRAAAASDLPEPARIRQLDLPALIIATRGDPGHPLSTAEKLAELLPRAELVVLDDLTQLAKAREALTRFVTRAIDLYSPDTYAAGAPYSEFARLRRERPIHWQETPGGGGYWALTKHADVVEVSRNPELFSSARGFVVIEELAESQLAMMRMSLLGMDPPEHARLRRTILGAFTPRVVTALEPRVREITREILSRAADHEDVEFVEEVAGDLPMQVIGELLGVPEAERGRLRGWAAQLTGSQDSDLNPGGADAAPAASIEMAIYAIGLAQSRRGGVGTDLTTLAVNAQVDGHSMSDAEFGGFFVQLATAGNDTTRNLLSQGLRLLLEHPDQLESLRRDESLIPGAVEEMLRYESPLHYFRRTATRDTELRGQAIRAGERVVLYYGAANRDPDVFPDPERFDVRRAPNPHLSFGFGEHFCLGAALARLEARVFFEELLRAFPRIELTSAPRHQRSNLNNALKSLHVRLHAA